MDGILNVPATISISRPIRPELEPVMAVLFMMIDEMRSIVVHVTSTHHGEGATTVAREIAAAAAASGWCKVALIDATISLKGPQSGPATPSTPALIDYFERGEDPVLQLARFNGLPISVARLTARGCPVTKVDSVRGLYGLLRSNYNLVIVDCPPVITGQQAAALASVADGTLLVVEAERTRVADIALARDTLEQLGASILGVVLNKSKRRIQQFISRMI